jgi:hypothetical protein
LLYFLSLIIIIMRKNNYHFFYVNYKITEKQNVIESKFTILY